MKRLIYVAMLATACGGLQTQDAEDEFRAASPSRQGIDIKVPSTTGQGLESDDVGQLEQAELGQRAAWYTTTRAVTLSVNGATAWVLALCEAIIKHPATTVTDDQAVWGPWTDSLSPNTYRFTVTRAGTGYDYMLEGKDKTAGDDAFVALISGHHEPTDKEYVGSGSFTADWDAAATLPEHGDIVGKGVFTYARNENLDVTVGVDFQQVKDDQDPTKRVDAEYAFAKVNEGDGSFEFRFTNAASEKFTIKSRWHDDGAGRADINAYNAGGTVLGTISECWGSTFLETYYAESWNPSGVLGEETDCVFATAEFSTL